MCTCENKNICSNSEISRVTLKETNKNSFSKPKNRNKELKNSLYNSSKITEFISPNKIEENEEENILLNTAKNTIPTNNALSNRSNHMNISLFSQISFESIQIDKNDNTEIIKDDKNGKNIFCEMSKIEENKTEKKILYDRTSKNSLNKIVKFFRKEYKLKKQNEKKNSNLNDKNEKLIIDYEGEQCVFNGELEDNEKINGEGSIVLSNGRKFEGNFINGKLNGFGKYIDENGAIYEGNFDNGVLNGNGKIIKIKEEDNDINKTRKEINKITYIGNIKNFKKEGFGKEICPEYIYEGNYHDDMRNGKGKIKFLNKGDFYEGEFLNDKITGYGKYIWFNNQEYIGNFFEGDMNGKGKYIWPDGKEYEGDYVNNKREGEGQFKWKNGDIFKGVFHEGKPCGKGIMILNGITYNGEFKKGHFKVFGEKK